MNENPSANKDDERAERSGATDQDAAQPPVQPKEAVDAASPTADATIAPTVEPPQVEPPIQPDEAMDAASQPPESPESSDEPPRSKPSPVARLAASTELVREIALPTFRRVWSYVAIRASRIAFRIYGAFVILVIATILAGVVGWFSLDNVGGFQDQINNQAVPAMNAAFGIAQHANTLVAAGPRLVATTNPEDYQTVSDEASQAHQSLVSQLALLQGQNVGDERYGRMRVYVDELITNTHEIQEGMVKSFPRTRILDTMRHQIDDLSFQLNGLLKPAADDQYFYMSTGYYSIEDSPHVEDQSLTPNQLTRYRLIASLASDTTSALQLLESAFGAGTPSALEPLRERYVSTMKRIDHNMARLERASEGEDSEYVTLAIEDLTPLIENLEVLGNDVSGAFGLLNTNFRVAEERQRLLEANRSVAVDLLSDVDVFVDLSNENVEAATVASGQSVFGAKMWILAVSIIAVAGAAFMAWIFIRRFLLVRLEALLESMRRMAFGSTEDLREVTIDTGGRDEVAAMAYALDIFRQNSLDALELDEVRRLNEQLEATNVELAEVVRERETALTELNRAQDQIVARDKLAALGELTAGVAHEIRNPLNFVKNFSEGGVELIEELREVLEEAEEDGEEADLELISELAEDLFSNFEFIISHSNRADSIVTGMLAMGRGSTEFHPTDLNHLLDEYARLAFHSARATDPDFQLDMKFDLDDSMVEIPVIPQDFSRVIVNIVSNSCYATNARRLKSIESGASITLSPGGYMPTVWLSTRLDGEHAEVRIRDNGGGIPEDVVDKIFNPFFTTKPTNEGTGLGLAMCTDIIRGHGGAIGVEVEPGEGTEMTIRIPTARADTDAIVDDIAQLSPAPGD